MTMLSRSFLFLLFAACAATYESHADEPRDSIVVDADSAPSDAGLVLAHYMPWYEVSENGSSWGWHWTMNHFDPKELVDGKRSIASTYYPLIGPYDSGDPVVLEFHLLTMKLAGIDGVIVDWYGLEKFRDYSLLHRNTERLIEACNRLGMRFAICYEDQTIPALVEAGRLKASHRADHAAIEIEWLATNWFPMEGYVKIDSRPLLLSFGQTGLSNDEWSRVIQGASRELAYFSQHLKRTAARGAFDWPIPTEGLAAMNRFLSSSRAWPDRIPVVFPRFVDIYAEAEVQPSHGRIEDADGQTFRQSLEKGLAIDSHVIQIATWNDWGEGTQIEPSNEFGFRDLEYLQNQLSKRAEKITVFTASDLRIPLRLLRLRKGGRIDESRLDEISERIVSGDLVSATSELESAELDASQ